MGILNFILGQKNKKKDFVPDLQKTEYENWLEFLEIGGTSDEWTVLISENKWNFKEDETKIHQKYLREVKYSSDKYYDLLMRIQSDWSKLSKSKDYFGELAKTIEKNCKSGIKYYMKMKEIDEKYGEETPINVPAITRLAMLYEKQEKYNESIEVCKQACELGIDESSRMKRMIKKVNREIRNEEQKLIDSFKEK